MQLPSLDHVRYETGEMGSWGGGEVGGQMREKVILLSPHLLIPPSPHPLSMPNAP